MTYSPNHFLKF